MSNDRRGRSLVLIFFLSSFFLSSLVLWRNGPLKGIELSSLLECQKRRQILETQHFTHPESERRPEYVLSLIRFHPHYLTVSSYPAWTVPAGRDPGPYHLIS